jgi:hypothetical protein
MLTVMSGIGGLGRWRHLSINENRDSTSSEFYGDTCMSEYYKKTKLDGLTRLRMTIISDNCCTKSTAL